MSFWDFLPGVKKAKEGRQTIERATKKATTEIRDFRDLLMPQISGGDDALALIRGYLGLDGEGRQRDLYGNFQTDPGFQASTDFGIDNIVQRGHALGLGKSGGTREDVGTFSSRMMQGAYNDRLSSLYRLLGVGQNATAQYGNATSNLANTIMGGAQQQAAYGMEQGNAAMSALNTAIGLGAYGLSGGFERPSYGSTATALPITTSSYATPDFRRLY